MDDETHPEATAAPRRVCPKPCKACPFKRTSWPGYLGDDTPQGFIEKTENGVAMPCHLTVDYETPDWKERAEQAPLCSGALTFLANSCKLPFAAEWMHQWLQDDIAQVLVALKEIKPDHETVFSHKQEFLQHHGRFA